MAKANQGKPVKENIAVSADASVWIFSLLTDFDVALFISGKHFRLYEKMGAHLLSVNHHKGTYFSVWAPNAQDVYVAGDFNRGRQLHTGYIKDWMNRGSGRVLFPQ